MSDMDLKKTTTRQTISVKARIVTSADKFLIDSKKTEIIEAQSLFSNLDFSDAEVFGMQQVIKETLDIAREIPTETIDTQEARGTQELKFNKGEKGIRVEANRGWGLNTTFVGQEITSNLHSVRSARFLQNVASLYSYAVKRGSFRVNSNITDIMRDTGAYTGKRIYPDSKKVFSEDIILANRTDLLIQTPTYSYRDKKGNVVTKKVGKYEQFDNYVRLFKLDGVLWATDRNGTKTYVKKILGELLPDIKNKGWLRATAFVKGFFKLDYANEANRIFLSSYLIGRFSQNQDNTINNKPLKLERSFLILQADYQKTEEANKTEASNKLIATLNKLKSLGIIGDWFSERTRDKKISTDGKERILIYPPTALIKSLVSNTAEAVVEESELIVKLKLYKKNNGLTETAKWLGCDKGDIDKVISGEIKLSDKQIEKLANN